MACCAQGSGNSESDKKNKEINRMLKSDGHDQESEIVLLLLGAGESGKSTFAKQMKIIHMEGFNEEELSSYKPLIFQNAFGGMKTLLKACEDLGIKLENKKSKSLAKKFLDNGSDYFNGSLTPTIAKDISVLWSDPAVLKAFERRSEFQLSDCVEYYMERILELGSPDYLPTPQDVLRTRAKTTGIIEIEFNVDKTKFKMVDVGGQRNERKKWMHHFEEVTAIIFCVALSEYDLLLEEDGETNRMHESLNVFNHICNSKWFVKTSIILFLNKKDLFQEKIKKVPLKVCFDDYKGGDNWEVAAEFIGERFCEQNKCKGKEIYVHVTCATDTSNVRFVFDAVKDIILQQALDASGLRVM